MPSDFVCLSWLKHIAIYANNRRNNRDAIIATPTIYQSSYKIQHKLALLAASVGLPEQVSQVRDIQFERAGYLCINVSGHFHWS